MHIQYTHLKGMTWWEVHFTVIKDIGQLIPKFMIEVTGIIVKRIMIGFINDSSFQYVCASWVKDVCLMLIQKLIHHYLCISMVWRGFIFQNTNIYTCKHIDESQIWVYAVLVTLNIHQMTQSKSAPKASVARLLFTDVLYPIWLSLIFFFCQEEWAKMSMFRWAKLIETCSKRCAGVTAAKRRCTKYWCRGTEYKCTPHWQVRNVAKCENVQGVWTLFHTTGSQPHVRQTNTDYTTENEKTKTVIFS